MSSWIFKKHGYMNDKIIVSLIYKNNIINNVPIIIFLKIVLQKYFLLNEKLSSENLYIGKYED